MRLVEQRVGEADHALLVGVRDHQRALAVLEELLEHHDLADALEAEGLDHVERLVEHDLLATLERVDVDRRADVHPQLAAAGEHLDRAVVLRLEEHAEPGRRLGQPVDLLLEGDDLVPGLLEGGHEPFVLGRDRGQVRLRLVETLLQNPGLTGGFRELATQRGDLLLQEGDLCCEIRDLPFALRGPSLSVVASCHAPSPPSQSRATTQDPTYLRAIRNLAVQCSCCHIQFPVINPRWCVYTWPAWEHGNLFPCLRIEAVCGRIVITAGSRSRWSSSSPYAPLAGRLRLGGGITPSAMRRAVTRNPVWPTIRWSGRTASPSTCQSRTRVSHACGSVKLPCSRNVSTVLDSCVVVAT